MQINSVKCSSKIICLLLKCYISYLRKCLDKKAMKQILYNAIIKCSEMYLKNVTKPAISNIEITSIKLRGKLIEMMLVFTVLSKHIYIVRFCF